MKFNEFLILEKDESLNGIVIKKPSQCSPEEIREFYNLVAAGGEYSLSALSYGIKKSPLLGFYFDNGDIVSVAAIKTDEYKDFYFDQANVSGKRDYKYELGWFYTLSDYRGQGLSSKLAEKLLNKIKSKKIFATTRINNIAMIKILERNGFTRLGTPYQGRTAPIQLWVYE
jgi:GNAT superfamily N-acetyltransferase